MNEKELRKTLRQIKLGESILLKETGLEIVKTKQGYKDTKGNKWREKDILPRGYTINIK